MNVRASTENPSKARGEPEPVRKAGADRRNVITSILQMKKLRLKGLSDLYKVNHH